MKIPALKPAVFLLGCAASAAVWIIFMPRQNSPAPARNEPLPAIKETWSADRRSAALKALDGAATSEARIKAVIELGRIPQADVQSTLESITLMAGPELTLACKTLLIRWGAADGEAAANWAWQRFYKEGRWAEAFREVGSSWAWHDPAGLCRWAIAAPRKPYQDIQAADQQAADSEVPLLESREFDWISRWIVSEEPRLAFELMRTRGGFSTSDGELAGRLQSVGQVHEALEACPGLDDLKPNTVSSDQMAAWSLLNRWKELDPKSFDASEYAPILPESSMPDFKDAAREWSTLPAGERVEAANRLTRDLKGPDHGKQVYSLAREWAAISPPEAAQWLQGLPDGAPLLAVLAEAGALKDLTATLAWADTLPPAERQKNLIKCYDTWTGKNPGQQPDMSAWTPAQTDVWKDLEALGKPAL